MEGILAAIAALTPLNVGLSILGGVIFGFLYRNFNIDSVSIFLLVIYVTAFSVGRVLFVGAVGTASGTGLLGTLLFAIYVLSTMITRRIFRSGRTIKIDGKDIKF